MNLRHLDKFLFLGGLTLAQSIILPGAAAAETGWQTGAGYRWKPTSPVTPSVREGFTLLDPADLGIVFTNLLTVDRAIGNHNLMNGAGTALGDFDGDGRCDIYLCNIAGTNALFRNVGGWKFRDVTVAQGLTGGGRSATGAVFADLDGNGKLDLVLASCGGPNSCFLNEGSGRFREVPLPPGDVTRTGSTSIALGDVDGDGDLDLYIANYGENSIMRSGGTPATRMVNGKEEIIGRYRNRVKIRPDGKMIELGEPDVLYLNDGKAGFKPVSWVGGTFTDEDGLALQAPLWDFGLAVMFRDINNDRHPDIYVCNDFQTPDRVWINDGRGRFHAISRLAMRHTSNFSMSVDFADINRDGQMDFFLADMLSRSHLLRMIQMDGNERSAHFIGAIDDRPQVRRNTMMIGRGDGTFTDVANFAGLQASDWTWSGIFLDVDLDGFEDLLIGNGHAFDTQDLDAIERSRAVPRTTVEDGLRKLLLYPKLETPNYVFRNLGNLTFEEHGTAWGFNSTRVSNGMAVGDLDDDGDLDVVVNCLNAAPLIYRNESQKPRVSIRLKGRGGNTQGTGALIKVLNGAVPVQMQEMISGGRYLSGDDACRTFAGGSPNSEMKVHVLWRSGKTSEINGVKSGRIYEIEEPSESIASTSNPSPTPNPPLFAEVSNQLSHVHPEAVYNDFEFQPLLPRRLSQSGPGVAIADVNGDRHDDLFVGSGKDGTPALFLGTGPGGFSTNSQAKGLVAQADDQLGVALFADASGRRFLLAAQANYEKNQPSTGMVESLMLSGGQIQAAPLKLKLDDSSPGPVAVADVDGDGDLDLFVGGRVRPAKYPAGARSALFIQDSGEWKVAPGLKELDTPGALVTGALFSDLNGDGYPELILACEWGAIRVFENQKGSFRETTAELGLGSASGWWNCVTTVDLDGDGQLDLVAGNWGLNTPWRASAPEPLLAYFGDFDGNGTFDLLEAVQDKSAAMIVPIRNLEIIGKALPFVRLTIQSHRQYGESPVEKILGDAFASSGRLAVNELSTRAWLKRDGRFVPYELPQEVQWAPIFGIATADFNNDGREDIFLSQNFFAMRAEDARQDAGRGLLLLGNASGRMEAISMKASGIEVFGEQRGAAVGDFDEDGRTDLVVSQNGSRTRLFKNQGSPSGLRIRLKGPVGNPDAVGAQIRLGVPERMGALREIRGGGGSLSQDSTVQILAYPPSSGAAAAGAGRVEIRWPGGNRTSSAVPDGAREVEIDTAGAIRLIR